MSILIIGDPHIKRSNEIQTTILQNDIMKTIQNENIIFVVILGDILHDHGKADMECYNKAVDLFELISSTGKPLFVLIGNHDRSDNKVYMTNRHFFRGFNGNSGIKIVDKCFIYEMSVRKLGINSDNIMKFCFVPYVPDGMYFQALQDCNIDPTEMTMFFSHSEINGEFATCGFSKHKCDVWPSNYPLNVVGHIHNKRILQDNLIYVGTPYQHDYNDSQDKGIYLLNLIDNSYSITQIKTSIPPKIIIPIHYTQLDQLQLDKNYDVRLEIYGPTTHVEEIMRRPDMIKKFGHVSKKYKDDSTKSKAKLDQIQSVNNLQFYQKLLLETKSDPRMNFIHQTLFTKSI